ncbi:hypothetical protein V8E36_006878 [Tilletia maclaganii]
MTLYSRQGRRFLQDLTLRYQLALFTALLSAACAHGQTSPQAESCAREASSLCKADTGPAYQRAWIHCMAPTWKTLTTNNKCPHSDVGCLCYSGCVKERSEIIADVGGWCTVACRLASQPSPGP